VHDPGSWNDAVSECERSSSAELIASYDALAPDDRAWLDDLRLRRWDDPDGITAAEAERGDRLEARGLRIAVFDSPLVCARDRTLNDDDNDVDAFDTFDDASDRGGGDRSEGAARPGG